MSILFQPHTLIHCRKGKNNGSVCLSPGEYLGFLQLLRPAVSGCGAELIACTLLPESCLLLVRRLQPARHAQLLAKLQTVRCQLPAAGSTPFLQRSEWICTLPRLQQATARLFNEPLACGLTDNPREWPYSNLAELLGEEYWQWPDPGILTEYFRSRSHFELCLEAAAVAGTRAAA